MFSHPFYAQVLALSLLKASFGGFATPGIPLPLVRPSTSFIDDDVLAEFRRSQPIPCQHPRLTATSALTWQPKPSSVTRSEGRIYKQHLSAERPGHDTALAMFSHPFYAQLPISPANQRQKRCVGRANRFKYVYKIREQEVITITRKILIVI
ncbi:uncharacterized protein [Dermacentor albipictus]|uniref:uncharacterized protein isoform X2 n=1 Tax=Dermacentor albipictus TaxID=60249 RepID=UPI0031FDCFAC